MHFHSQIELSSRGFSDIIDISNELLSAVKGSGIKNGLVTVFVPGSTGSITTIEFEPGVIEDLKEAIERIAPSAVPYKHDERWGDGNGFSHVRAALLKPGISIPLVDGSLTLGMWQQVVFIDFDNKPRKRLISIQVLGE